MTSLTHFPAKGQWVRWLTESVGREGEIITSQYPSLVIRWVGVDEPQVFPLAHMYFESGSSSRMELIAAPKEAPRERQQGKARALSVNEAAAFLGTSSKAVRKSLRSGKLKGLHRDGRWVTVYI